MVLFWRGGLWYGLPFPNSVEVPPKVPSLLLLSWWEHASPWGFDWTRHFPPVATVQWQKLPPKKREIIFSVFLLFLSTFLTGVRTQEAGVWCARAGCWLPGWARSRGPPSLSCRLLPCNRDDAGLIAGPLQFCVAPLIYTAGLNFEGVSDLPRSRLTIGTRCLLVNTCTF